MTSKPEGISSGGVGSVVMDNRTMDIETLLMVIQAKRADALQGQMMENAAGIKTRSELLKQFQKALAELRKKLGGMGDHTKDVKLSQEIRALMEKWGIKVPWTGNKANKEQINLAMDNIKGFMDAKNSDAQMDMIRLQSLQTKFNQSIEIMTNTFQKFAKTKDSIISNMR